MARESGQVVYIGFPKAMEYYSVPVNGVRRKGGKKTAVRGMVNNVHLFIPRLSAKCRKNLSNFQDGLRRRYLLFHGIYGYNRVIASRTILASIEHRTR